MPVDIKVPSVGESITEGTLARWLKANGAAVRANGPVCELETDKATTEVMAPASGTLSITVPEGQKVSIGAVVGRIEEGAAPPARPAPARTPAPAAAAPAGNSSPAAPAPAAAPPRRGDSRAPSPEAPLSPAARHLAANEGIDARQLTGTGRGGRVTKED